MLALVLSTGAFMLWIFAASYIWPARPAPPSPATAPGAAATGPARPTATGLAAATTTTGPADGFAVAGADGPRTTVLGGASPTSVFPMEIGLTNVGAAVREVSLRDYKWHVDSDRPYPLLVPLASPESGETYCSFATEKVRVETFQADVPLDEVAWEIDAEGTDEDSVTFRVVIEREGRPVLEVRKTYSLARGGPKVEGRGARAIVRHDMRLEYAFRNLARRPLDVILVQRGPVGIPKEDLRVDDRGVLAAVREGDETAVDKKHVRKEVVEKGEVPLGKDTPESVVDWVALANKYFGCIVRPVRSEGSAWQVAKAAATHLTESRAKDFGEDLTFEIVTAPIAIEPGAARVVCFECYLGPKSKTAFQQVAAYAGHNYFELIRADFYCCAPAPVARLMMWLLQTLYWPVHNYGLAIVALVIIVRVILHPVTKAGQVNMMKLQKQMARLQPRIEEIRRKYANDRERLNRETMAVYAEAGISPLTQMWTCLPLALQVPIWAGLWAALSSTVEMRHAPLDGYWIKDLAGPDAVVRFGRAYDVPPLSWVAGPIGALNLLPILLAVTMYLQQKYMPRGAAGAGQTSEQMAQQKLMNFMTVFFGLMFYNAPSGLTLYIMSSNLFAIVEQWRIRQHVREMEAKAREAPPRSGTGLKVRKPRWYEWLEKQAEEARKVKSSRKD